MDHSDTSPTAIISDNVSVNGTVTLLTLTSDGELRWKERRQRRLIVEKQVLGFVMEEGGKVRIRTLVDNGDGICCGGSNGNGALVRKDFVFQPLTEESGRLWCQHLRDYLNSLGRPRRVYIFVNPYGGNKSASKVFVDVVKPLLEDADVEFTLQETKRQLHAKDVAMVMDLSKYDGIVCVSGDGVLVEVVNGLLTRDDWRDAIKIPLGLVPAGTGNGMAKSLLDSVGEPCKASNAVLTIIRGHKRALDVATILQGETRFFSVLMLSWGLVADIDIESEKYRWMGSARLDFYALQRIFNLREYNGCISFVPAPGFESYGEPTSYPGEPTDKQSNPISSQQRRAVVKKLGYQGPDVNLVNLDWRMLNGPFVSVWLHNVPWGSEGVMAAPDAKFSDGYLDLLLIRECPKFALLKLMTDLSNGSHVKSPYVMYLKVKAFILEPGTLTVDSTRGGIIDVDGEVLAKGNGVYKSEQKTLMVYDKLQMTIDQGLATLFSPVSHS